MDNTFKQFITEKYYNAFTLDQKKKYVDQVWDILEQSYKPIGGLRGIKSKQDIVDTMPMWKLAVVDNKVLAALLYKDKGAGRKLVAVATNGTKAGKDVLREMTEQEFKRSFFEVSGPFFKFIEKNFPDLVKKYTIPPEQVEQILGKVVAPTKDGWYKRTIKGDILEKIMLGTPGKSIKH